jgi:phosphatidylglycerol---prolipoprotein diacylglyceryl transferase
LEIFATWQGRYVLSRGLHRRHCWPACCTAATIASAFWKAADLYVVTVPIGLGLGRIGNFINGELFGRTTDVPMGQ